MKASSETGEEARGAWESPGTNRGARRGSREAWGVVAGGPASPSGWLERLGAVGGYGGWEDWGQRSE